MSPLISLPLEILDFICSGIDSRDDLISLASTSKILASLVIPRHVDYRTIRVGSKRTDVWEHLIQRKDLARNVRVLYIVEDMKYIPLRCPSISSTQAAESRIDHDDGEEKQAQCIVEALRNMESLRKFVWIQPWASGVWKKESRKHCLIFQALRESCSLTELKILDTSVGTPSYGDSPIFNISDLETLCLEGWFWRRMSDHSSLTSMISKSPNLQSLSISFAIESPAFWQCKLPQLRRLSITGNIFSRSYSDDSVLRFLETHPSLEDLIWHPRDMESSLAPGSLPNLRRLETTHDFAMTLLQDGLVEERRLERLGCIQLDESTWECLERNLNGLALRELSIGSYDRLESLHSLASKFPTLTTLDIKAFGTVERSGLRSRYSMDDYIDALSRFRHLENLPDIALWERLQRLNEIERNTLIHRLVERCPRLIRLGHWDQKTRSAVGITLLRREAGVIWEERPRYTSL
ncbi:hypothetical protein Hypma_001061 [Hypsizygus marmoreus]|uniref:F-box domain-containing protein n=1 Tax=Hypsizygus marmoreus TaxID=39966 RepID=A0A369JFI6_HYPMA|nr:hypothetical protein Hypma_001061 [Hypsizygus marmoreus]